MKKKLKIYGNPLTPRFGTFAFQYDPHDQDIWTGRVPDDTDILLTHGPPRGYLDDGGKGCAKLLGEMRRTRPRLVVFGHIHRGRGERRVWFDDVEAGYERVISGERPWVTLGVMVWKMVCFIVARMIRRRRRPAVTEAASSQLVNAAMVGGQYGRERREPIVTFL